MQIPLPTRRIGRLEFTLQRAAMVQGHTLKRELQRLGEPNTAAQATLSRLPSLKTSNFQLLTGGAAAALTRHYPSRLSAARFRHPSDPGPAPMRA